MNVLAKFTFTFFPIAIAFFFINTFLLRDQEIDWGLRFIEYKKFVARSIHEPKIVFTGGSGVLFGLRGETLQEELKIPAVNLGVSGGFSLNFVLDIAKEVLSPGDIFIFGPEYVYYDPDVLKDLKYDFHYLRINKPRKLIDFEPKRLAHYVFTTNFIDSIYSTITFYLRSFRQEANIKPVDLNVQGDYASCESSFNGEVPYVGLPDGENLMKYISVIQKFHEWAKERNVLFIHSFPNLAAHEKFHLSTWKSSGRILAEEITKAGILNLGEPYDFVYDAKYFCNSNYHLNRLGGIMHTKKFIEFLKPLLKSTARPV